MAGLEAERQRVYQLAGTSLCDLLRDWSEASIAGAQYFLRPFAHLFDVLRCHHIAYTGDRAVEAIMACLGGVAVDASFPAILFNDALSCSPPLPGIENFSNNIDNQNRVSEVCDSAWTAFGDACLLTMKWRRSPSDNQQQRCLYLNVKLWSRPTSNGRRLT